MPPVRRAVSSEYSHPASGHRPSPTSASSPSSTAVRSRLASPPRAGETVTVVKDLGLVANVFDEADLAGLDGHMGIGHTRYSTTGSSSWENAQPVHRQKGSTSIALGHNGNLTNTKRLAEQYGDGRASTDSDLMLEAIARQVDDERGDLRGLEMAMRKVLPEFEGAFSLVVMDQGHLVGVRDPRASGHCASDASPTAAGCWPRRPPRSTSSAPTSSARWNPARWS
jgi:hypothetical protein